jgi:protein-S-isoprenylcysteine O-methyltransferase Ste14
MTHLRHRKIKAKVKGDKGSLLAYYAGIAVFLGAVVALPDSFFGAFPSYAFYVGIALMFAGIGLRQWAIATLSGSFSLSVVVRDGQKLVDRGPYSRVRHPSYTGIAVTLVGFGLALGSLAVIVISGAVFLPVLAYRIRVEEGALKESFGLQYQQYMERTKRLIPFLF